MHEDDEEIEKPVIEDAEDAEGGDDAAGGDQDDAGSDAEEEVLTVQIGDEEPEQDETAGAPEWVKELRRKSREDQRRIRELEEKLNGDKAETKVGPEPTLASCDYDEAEFKAKWAEWNKAKQSAEAEEAKAKEAQEEADKRWQGKLERMQERKKELKVPDIEDAEDFIRETFSVVQQGIVVQGAEDPALLFLALSRNPKKARELATITDPVEYAFAIAKTEVQLKVGKKSSAPPPERSINGRAGTGATVDNTLERLREKAARTGDMSEVIAYKRKLRAKADA